MTIPPPRVKILAGNPPAETTPVVVTVTPRQRADFVPLAETEPSPQ